MFACIVSTFLLGIAIGALITYMAYAKPYETGYDEGYKTAKRTYTDWDAGFDCGYEAAMRGIKNNEHTKNKR